MLKGLIFLIYTSMDKKLLDGLDNLSEALIMIAEALEKKGQQSNSATTNALVSGDFTTQIKEINVGIKSIKKDTTKILENQQTILEMSKKKDKKSNVIEDVGGDQKAESNLKKGVTTILLIAVGVLAIGLAFKLIGDIDFLSVVGLSLAIVLVSIAFEKIAEMNIPIKQAVNTSFVMVIMAFAITASSFILSFITPIGFGQALTAILIAGMFTVIAFGIGKLVKAFEGMDPIQTMKTSLVIMFILPAMAMAITLSSWILKMVTPISFGQAITAILIAGMFTVISFGIGKLIKAFKGVDLVEAIKSAFVMLLILPAMAMAITASSFVLSFITPISFGQALTAILIAGMFTVISFGIGKLIKAFKGLDPIQAMKSAFVMVLVLPAMALAIAASSVILSFITPISLGQALTAILIAAVFVVLSYGMEKILKSISKMDYKDIPKIPIFFTLMSLAIAASAVIFSNYKKEINEVTFMMLLKVLILGAAMGIVLVIIGVAMRMMGNLSTDDLIKVPIMFTLIAVAIALSAAIFYNFRKEIDGITFMSMIKILFFSVCLAISVAIMAAGIVIVNTLGKPQDYLKGGISILIIAATIMATSLILGLGDYSEGKYPDWKWSLGVGLSLIAFGAAAVVLGTIAMSGVGALAILAGGVAILVVAATIVATSHILSKGKYGNYPGLGWAIGTGISLTAFGLAMAGLGSAILLSFGLGMTALVAGGEAVLLIAQTIVDSAEILSKGNFTGGPTLEWAGGIALALGAFSPIYAMLAANKIMSLFGGGVGPEDFANAIRTVSQGIVDSANYFAGVKVAFSGGPSKKWAEGVGMAISAFAPVYSALSSGGFFSTKVTPEDMKSGILTISDGIIAAALKFSDNVALFDITKVPSKTWGENVGSALQAFAPIFTYMSENSGWFTSGKEAAGDMVYGINSVAQAIITVAKRFASVKANIWDSYPKKEWINSIKYTITSFVGIVKSLEDTDWIELNSVSRVARKLVETASILSKGKFNQVIDPNFIKSLSRNVIGFAVLAKKLGEINEEDGLLKTAFGLDPVSRTANSMIKLANAYDKMANALKKFGGALASIDGQKVDVIRRLTGNMAVLAAMNEQAFASMMTTLENKGSVFAKLIDTDKTKTGPVVGEGKGKKGPMDLKTKPKSKYGETYQQLDIMIDLLNNINRNTSQLDEFLDKQGFKTGELEDLTMKKEK